MSPEQEGGENALHLCTLGRHANAVFNRVYIREYACPLLFYCRCRVGLSFTSCASAARHMSTLFLSAAKLPSTVSAGDTVDARATRNVAVSFCAIKCLLFLSPPAVP